MNNSQSLLTKSLKQRLDMRRLFSNLASAIRGRFSVSKNVIRITRKELRRFKALSNLSEETKTNLLPRVRHYETQLSYYRFLENLFSPFVYVPLMFTTLTAMFYPLIFTESFGNFGFLLFFLIDFFIIGNGQIMVRLGDFNALNILKAQSIIFGLITGLLALYRGPMNVATMILFGFALGATIFLAGVIFALVALTILKTFFLRIQRTTHPEAVIVHGLIEILSDFDNVSSHWTDVSLRRLLLAKLEAIARCIQDDLNKKLKSNEIITDGWFETTTKQIAASLRSKKLWILTPKVDTRTYFIQSITDMIVAIVRDDWDSLEKVEPEKITVTRLWGERIRNALVILFIGLSPIGVLWFIQTSPLALDHPISDYAVALTLLWAVFTIITTIDPNVGTKIDAMKGVFSILPGSKKE